MTCLKINASTASSLTPGEPLAKEQHERPARSAAATTTTRAPGGLPSFLLGDFPGSDEFLHSVSVSSGSFDF
ncbi:hypothetical protein IHE44_0009317 [Lamprotornis superbus]|uniref:Uncharacterized protein n=1 Tax=Lamprotornis superbus TaxID=245042 RepID=A0A835U247_9PASS|nr:hypothetical protein IHE44_0009317 [Lamprotornis superbus]